MKTARQPSERAISFLSPLSDEMNSEDISKWPQGPSPDTECIVVPERIFYLLASAIEQNITIERLSEEFDIEFVTYEECSIFDVEKLKSFSELCFEIAKEKDVGETKLTSDRKHGVAVALLYSISAMCHRAALRGSGLIIYT